MSQNDRPVLALFTSHWLSLLGAGLMTTAGILWLFVLPSQLRGHGDNPYVGIILFGILPAVFATGLVLIPVGLWLARRKVRAGLSEMIDRASSIRRLGFFLGATTVVNVLIGSQLTYTAVHHMESVGFCGTSCHVMKPEYAAYQGSPHSRVMCTDCHVGPGARGWFESKMAGMRQLVEVAFNTYPRPVPPAVSTGRLVPANETCENCHWPEKFQAMQLRVFPNYADDEANTLSQTVLVVMIGGKGMPGVHGSHFGPGIEISYASKDSSRQEIPWVEYKNTQTGETKTFLAEGASPVDTAKLERHRMQCVDCHNRPTHAFDLPERAVNNAMANGDVPVTLPFIRKKGVELLKATYSSQEEAAQKIQAGLLEFYQKDYPKIAAERRADVDRAAEGLSRVFNRNVFPDLKVNWGTYPNHIGHTDFPGCFRCHDDKHKSAAGKTITQDCSACHQLAAMDEKNPEVLKTLGVNERLDALQKK